MANVNNVFGFELFQKLYYDDIHKKEDVLICTLVFIKIWI